MCDRPWETMTDADFEAMLARSVPDTPPEEIVADVTPWRRAMNRILFGMALCAITLNFWCLNYILPAIGTVLLLLGFRALRRENRWLGGCFAVTVIRAACFFATLILNTTILQSAVFTPAVTTALTAVNAVLLLALYFCFWRGLLAVQAKAGLPAQAGGALALIVWYALVCVLAAVQYGGWVVPIAMLIGYGFILRSLYRLSGALDEAGYAIAPQPVRVTDRCLVLVLAAVLGIGGALGYLFGGSYRMAARGHVQADADGGDPAAAAGSRLSGGCAQRPHAGGHRRLRRRAARRGRNGRLSRQRRQKRAVGSIQRET